MPPESRSRSARRPWQRRSQTMPSRHFGAVGKEGGENDGGRHDEPNQDTDAGPAVIVAEQPTGILVRERALQRALSGTDDLVVAIAEQQLRSLSEQLLRHRVDRRTVVAASVEP